jgi:two-component system sensor histidine kinase AtoS
LRVSLNFGRQVLVLVTILLLIPVAVTVFMLQMINKSESALVQQQKVRLMRAVEQLDESLPTGFDTILKKNGADETMPVREKVAILNNELRGLLRKVKSAYPGAEVGFYSAELDRIIDGSPQPYAGENFSSRRRQNFLGAMQGQVKSEAYGPTEGGILEIYKPLMRQGRIIGAVWATESLSKFAARRQAIAYTSYAIIMVGVLLGLGGAILVVHRFVQNVNQVKVGLRSLRYNLEQPLVSAAGELREITDAINELAAMLVRAQEYTKVMLATIDDGLLVIDLEGRVVIANAAISKTLGLAPDCIGVPFAGLLPQDAPFHRFLQEALLKGVQTRDVPVTWRCPEQGERRLLTSTAVLLSSRQQPIGVVLLLRDVTERFKLQAEMRRQEKLVALGRLVMGVAHEIRNPLTAINCYLQLWQKNSSFPQQPLATMRQEVSRLDSLVEKLLYFAKPAEARPVVYDVNHLVEEILPFFNDVVQVSIQADLGAGLPPVFIDPEQMGRVLQNIIYNACQSMPGGGLVTVSTYGEESGDHVVIRIKDAGCGIPSQNIRDIFEPFYTTKPRGMGLGLSLANEIVEAHGGRIEAESTVGRGTKMRIYLPVFKGEIHCG